MYLVTFRVPLSGHSRVSAEKPWRLLSAFIGSASECGTDCRRSRFPHVCVSCLKQIKKVDSSWEFLYICRLNGAGSSVFARLSSKQDSPHLLVAFGNSTKNRTPTIKYRHIIKHNKKGNTKLGNHGYTAGGSHSTEIASDYLQSVVVPRSDEDKSHAPLSTARRTK